MINKNPAKVLPIENMTLITTLNLLQFILHTPSESQHSLIPQSLSVLQEQISLQTPSEHCVLHLPLEVQHPPVPHWSSCEQWSHISLHETPSGPVHRCYPNILSCIYHCSRSILLNHTGNHINNNYTPLYTRDLNNRTVADSSLRYNRTKWHLSNLQSSESRGTKPTEQIL